jgi:hypothetical protein
LHYGGVDQSRVQGVGSDIVPLFLAAQGQLLCEEDVGQLGLAVVAALTEWNFPRNVHILLKSDWAEGELGDHPVREGADVDYSGGT